MILDGCKSALPKKHLKHDFDHGGQTYQNLVMTAYFSLHLFAITNHLLPWMQLGNFLPTSRTALQSNSNKNRTAPHKSESNVAKKNACQKVWQAKNMRIRSWRPFVFQKPLETHVGVSKNSGTPKCMVYNGKPFKMDNLGGKPTI